MPCLPSSAQNPQSKRQLEKESVQPQKNSQPRVALVIGNGAYEKASRLSNPPNDAEDIAAALRRLVLIWWAISAHVNRSADQMKRLIVDFGEMLNAGGVGLFYYAGHGVQSQGHNYLIPVEANILRERTLEFEAVDVNRVLAQMDAAGNGFNIVILDACRNNPFTRSWRDTSQGLAQVNAPEGTLIAYSTSPGRVASDGTGRNGTYTAELLRQMNSPGVTIEEMFKAVRVGVRTATKDQQTPWESSSLVGTFCFAGNCGSSPAKSATAAGDADEEFWSTIRNSSDPEDFRAYLKSFPNGRYVEIAQNNLRRLGAAQNATPSSQPPAGERKGNTQRTIQTVKASLYTFDLQQCRLSGSTIVCDLVITNNDRDRMFSFDNIVGGAGMIDDLGNTYRATSLQIANRNGFDDAVIPSNVPVKSRVTFDNVSSQATRIVSLRMQFNRYDPGINNTFRIEFRDVPLTK